MAPRLMPAFEERGAEVDVIEMQRAAANGDVHALKAAWLARLPREVVMRVMDDGMAAEDDVTEEVAPQVPRRRHHPAHPQQRAKLFRVALRGGSGANHLLQRDDVGVDSSDDLGDAGRVGAPVEPAAAMNVVGRDSQLSPL